MTEQKRTEKYDPAFVDEILRIDAEPEKISFDNVEAMLAWLNDHLPSCPGCGGKTRYDDPYLMCDACKRVVGMDTAMNGVAE